jgi:hypothetical protein
MNTNDIRKRVKCCACEGSLGDGYVNMITLRRAANWDYPVTSNLITGDGPCAVAICCDACLAQQPMPSIRWAVAFVGQRVFYHPVESLPELGPEPTHVISQNGLAIRCLLCGRTSSNENDVANRYCGHCHKFHPIEERPDRMDRTPLQQSRVADRPYQSL